MKILVVDDNDVNIRVVSPFLIKWGHNVVSSHDGADAIDKFKNENPDLILMDIVMPVMDGRESAKKIKELSGNKYIPIIFITALKSDVDMIESLESGGDDYITKPFDKNILFSKIKVQERILNLNSELDDRNKKLVLYNKELSREFKLVGRFFDWGQNMCDLDSRYISFYTSPVSAFNGDLFLVKRRPAGGLYVLVGDFTGHGLTAAIGTIPATEIFFRLADENRSIIDIVREINKILQQILPIEIFFAATVMEINQQADSVSVWSGGIPESYIVDKKNKKLIMVESQHMPLGVLDESEFDSSITTYSVEAGMKLYCATDGVIESFNDKREMYGKDRLKKILLESSENTVKCLLDDLKDFTGGKKQNDDTTVIEISFKVMDDVEFVLDGNDGRLVNVNNVLPFSLSFDFDADDMRQQNSLMQIADMLDGNSVLSAYKTYLFTIVTELYVSTLERGVLGLDSSTSLTSTKYDRYYQDKSEALDKLIDEKISITILMPKSCDEIIIIVSHSGSNSGFDDSNVDEMDSFLYDRGLAIVKKLCNDVEYSDNGKTVTVTYSV